MHPDQQATATGVPYAGRLNACRPGDKRMSASVSEHVLARADVHARLRQEAAHETAPLEGSTRDLWRMVVAILSVFWVYVTLSNVLFAHSLQASFEALSGRHFFANWDARVLEHLFLYPILLLSVWASLRIGWNPRWRRIPLQIVLGLTFAALAQPMLTLGELLTGKSTWQHMQANASAGHWYDWEWGIWIASTTTFTLTYGFGLALVTGFATYRRLRDAELRTAALERALNSSQLAALRMQLSPHTLFNLLHTIRGHIGWDPPAAQAMVVQLADLLRRLLNAGEREFTRLADELQFVRLYLELQQKRFADRLTVSVAPADTAQAAWVPSLILQPLVENAVVHGLAAHDGPVSIDVHVSVADETLILRVSNTIARREALGREGIGLRNVRERLAIQFGTQASFSAGVGSEGVWVATIRLPLLHDVPVPPNS
jgi:hypothetical protein